MDKKENQYIYKIYAVTDVGKRETNNDNFMIDTVVASTGCTPRSSVNVVLDSSQDRVIALSDGIGDRKYAGKSSDYIMRCLFARKFQKNPDSLKDLLERIDYEVSKCDQGGATLALVNLGAGGVCSVTNAGDSPVYYVDNNYKLCSAYEKHVHESRVHAENKENKKLNSLNNRVTRWIGCNADAEFSFKDIYAYDYKYIILCSDGFSNAIELFRDNPREFKKFLKNISLHGLEEYVAECVKEEKADNVTAIVIEVGECK